MENERRIKVEETAEEIVIKRKAYIEFLDKIKDLEDGNKFYKEDRKKLFEENHELRKQLEEVQKENDELKNGILYYVRKLGGK